MDHRIHLSILDQISYQITAASTALTVAHKADRVGDKNQTHKGTQHNKETSHPRIDSRDSKTMDTMVITSSNQGDSQPNSIIADQHQKHR